MSDIEEFNNINAVFSNPVFSSRIFWFKCRSLFKADLGIYWGLFNVLLNTNLYNAFSDLTCCLTVELSNLFFIQHLTYFP